jgi:xanthine phosphoribosyltransferase
MFKNDTKELILQAKDFDAEVVIGIARGGVTVAQMVAYGLNIRDLQTVRCELYDDDVQRDTIKIIENLVIENYHKILIVDDIVDSGKTLQKLLEHLKNKYHDKTFKTATLFYKPTSVVHADYKVQEAKEWIEFFWEKDYLVQ